MKIDDIRRKRIIFKSIEKGIYVNNYQNRKLGRVGQEYGTTTSQDESEKHYTRWFSSYNKEAFKEFLSENNIELSDANKNLLENNLDNIYFDEDDKKFHFAGNIRIPLTEENKKAFRIGIDDNQEKDENVLKLISHIAFFNPDRKFGYINEMQHYLDYFNNFDLHHSEKEKKEFLDRYKKYGNYDLYTLLRSRNTLKRFKNKEELLDFCQNSSRQEFSKFLKGIENKDVFLDCIKIRFNNKYNKGIWGEGWNDIHPEHKNYSIDVEKRDRIINLLNQIEKSIEVLGDDADRLFINNNDVKILSYITNKEFSDCHYSYALSEISVNDEFLKAEERSRKDTRLTTNQREGYFIGSFLHELGHSIEHRIEKNKDWNEFKKKLGFEGEEYTVYSDPILENNELFDKDSAVRYLKVERNSSTSEDFTFSNYANKSASEAFAEYFSFYMGNKKQIDKVLKLWKEQEDNPRKVKEYLKHFEKYSILKDLAKYNPIWNSLFPKKHEEHTLESLKALEYNYNLLWNIKNIVESVK